MVKADIITREKISSQFAENPILNKMAEHKADGYYKETPRYKEIVWGGVSHKIPKRAMNIDDVVFQRGFYLFAAVKNNVRQYLEKNNNVLPELKEYPVNHTNYDFDIDNLDILGVDLTAAYWYIARNLGFISQKVFSGAMKKISVEFNGETKEGDLLKPMRLSALSILGKKKTYYKIKDGKKTTDFDTVGGNELHEQVYKIIRHTCYMHMSNVADLLGKKEFLCWKTDCIYFHDTPENRKKVYDYFDSVNLDYKTLERAEEVAQVENAPAATE